MAFSLIAASVAAAAEEVSFKELESQARIAYRAGRPKEAFTLVNRAIASEPANPRGYLLRGKFHGEGREPAKAIEDYDRCIKLNPRVPDAWQQRGIEHFKLGHIEQSVTNFDKFIALVPQQASHHWQRGISLYYAGRFEEGRKQFELHQTVNTNDVENAVWHFLCIARADGLEKARAGLIPIQGDARVPMMEVHALFAGKLQPEDVLKAARSGGPPEAQLNRQLFYAHLYLGLYFEAMGEGGKAREHINKAAGEFQTGDYMGDVARVHRQLRWPEDRAGAEQNKSP
jgi:lipoprotein NlpI